MRYEREAQFRCPLKNQNEMFLWTIKKGFDVPELYVLSSDIFQGTVEYSSNAASPIAPSA